MVIKLNFMSGLAFLLGMDDLHIFGKCIGRLCNQIKVVFLFCLSVMK